MRRIALGAGLLIPLAVTACTSSHTSNSITAPSTTASASPAPSSAAAAPSAAASSSASGSVPKLAVGQSINVLIDPTSVGGPKAPIEFTLLAERSATSVTSSGTTEQAPSGMKFVCLEVRIRSTGSTTPDKHSIWGEWVGANGQVAQPQDALIDCSDMGVGKSGQDMFSQPNPAPGQFVEGWSAVKVPAGQGDLLWSRNSDDVPLFRTPG